MQKKQTLITAQALISLMMAFLMTGIFSFLELGFSAVWLEVWMSHFIVAWPIAFILSLFVSKIAFKAAIKLTA
ncbi:MFS transporter [Vibrio sp. 10N.286.49.B3]|uniref:DUF2798 domain-containing protein n=1 Tax=Vibrio sp. 10N.286.49.B3 TaxID=1880855 RepID=UPI000C85252F|nr:DUF2798 domain-containing protein [Vibrio sp. 10N.286.49.B3]PMH43258.1 MFS transporter [Vibrio sp. 10N.286.49.B3]